MSINSLQIFSPKRLAEILDVSRTTLWRLERSDPKFPQKIELSPNRVGFSAENVKTWLASRSAPPKRRRGKRVAS